jgi:hypothetical protein
MKSLNITNHGISFQPGGMKVYRATKGTATQIGVGLF